VLDMTSASNGARVLVHWNLLFSWFSSSGFVVRVFYFIGRNCWQVSKHHAQITRVLLLLKVLWNIFILVCLMVLNTTFNNIPVISWRSVLLVEETGGPGENHRPAASHWQISSHNVVSRPDRDSNSQHQWW
jgi:hypothetical protein